MPQEMENIKENNINIYIYTKQLFNSHDKYHLSFILSQEHRKYQTCFHIKILTHKQIHSQKSKYKHYLSFKQN